MISDLVILAFGLGMIWYGSQLVALTWNSTLPSLGISGAFDYFPVVAGGVLACIFALERTPRMRRQSDQQRPHNASAAPRRAMGCVIGFALQCHFAAAFRSDG